MSKARLILFGALLAAPALAQFNGATLPQHGGISFPSGALDAEVVLPKSGSGFQVFFRAPNGEELPASSASGVSLAVNHGAGPAEKIALSIDDSGEAWQGKSTSAQPGSQPITGAHLIWNFRGAAQDTEIPFAAVCHAEMENTPRAVKAGEAEQLGFYIRDFLGRPVKTLQIEHEKPMHLMIVSRDLADFWHIHPQPSPSGLFRVGHTFPNGGHYRLYVDYTLVNGPNRIESFDLDVAGPAKPPVRLTVTKNEAVMSGIRMVLTTNKPLRAMEDITFSMAVTDAASGAPVTNLQPYLGAWAHIAVISEDTQEFLHVHPIEEQGQLSAAAAKPGLPTPSTIRTATGFRHAGLYKMWVQVQRNGVVTAHPFVFQVAAAATQVSQGARPPAGATLVKVSSGGFEPATIQAKAGQPLKLAFYRPDAANCAREVVFPGIGIRKELPVGQTVVVDITPSKTGPLAFECGMKMLKGTLIVK